MSSPTSLKFETGTGYDLLASLSVLHAPARFGLRPSWAAGVRSRLPSSARQFLEQIQGIFPYPATWIHSLPAPRSADSVLWALGQLRPAQRLPTLALTPDTPEALRKALLAVAERQTWMPADLELARSLAPTGLSGRPRPWREILNWWAHAEEFGQTYLAALQAYHSVFFAEEEARIQPALATAAQRAQEMSRQVPLESLLDHLTGGLHIPRLSAAEEITLVPSYWLSPLAFFGVLSPNRMILVFGGRSPEDTLVPGEAVPDALLAALKALADPTRLQILRLLAQTPLTLTEISRSLRLRPPTITHHLSALRLAGLIQVDFGPDDEKRYAVRSQAAASAFESLQDYLHHAPE